MSKTKKRQENFKSWMPGKRVINFFDAGMKPIPDSSIEFEGDLKFHVPEGTAFMQVFYITEQSNSCQN